MKKFLLPFAIGAMALSSMAATHNIYVANKTTWGNDVALYSWNLDNVECFGQWPGATSVQETISGVTYDKFVVEGHDGEVANLIFNNNDNGQQVDLATVTLNEANYYFATDGVNVNQFTDPANPDVNFDPVNTYIYVLDNTGWDTLYAYAWATDQADVLGGWPGTAFTETVTIAGETYKRAAFPGNGTIQYNLIFNNGEGVQFDGPTCPSGKDIYLKLTADSFEILPTPGVSTYDIYITDNTGWDKLYLYAYYNAADSIFGGWPGIEVTETATVNGVEYKVIRGVEATDDAQNFIFNNGDGEQIDVEGEYPINADLFLVAGESVPVGDTYDIYIEDNTGWDDLYLYAYVGDEPSIFGAWPGVHVTETATVDGIDYKVVRNVPATEVAQTFIVNNNAGEQVDIEGEYAINENIYLNNVTSAVSVIEVAGEECIYFNLQGVRVAQPEQGIFICRQGAKVTKVVK